MRHDHCDGMLYVPSVTPAATMEPAYQELLSKPIAQIIRMESSSGSAAGA